MAAEPEIASPKRRANQTLNNTILVGCSLDARVSRLQLKRPHKHTAVGLVPAPIAAIEPVIVWAASDDSGVALCHSRQEPGSSPQLGTAWFDPPKNNITGNRRVHTIDDSSPTVSGVVFS